jgi:hypothetical protein
MLSLSRPLPLPCDVCILTCRVLLRESVDVQTAKNTELIACHDRCTAALHRTKLVVLRSARDLTGCPCAQVEAWITGQKRRVGGVVAGQAFP